MQCQVLSMQWQLLLELCRQAAAVWKGHGAWESWRERGTGGRALSMSVSVSGEQRGPEKLGALERLLYSYACVGS